MRKLFNAAFDFITGFDLDGELDKIMEMDTWGREAIEKYQQNQFEKLNQYAVQSEIYKDCSVTDLKDFPLYSKEFVQKNIDRFRTHIRNPYRLIYTSGSTGNPKKIYVSKEMILAKRASRLKLLRWYNLQREDKEVYIGGLAQSFTMQVYYFLKNKVYLPSNNLTLTRAREYIKIINRHKPRILYSYPYALNIILNYAERLSESIFQPDVICTIGENLHPDVKEYIKQHFPDSYIVNEYWATEANIGVSCPEGNIHADEDTVFLETVGHDKNGFGNLLITNFYSYDMPLIRYDLGDRVKLSSVPCSCGRKSMIIEGIEGRTVNYYYLKDGRRIAYMDMRISRFIENVIVYQVIHYKKDDTFLFKYVPANHAKAVNTSGLYNFFRKNLGVELFFKEVDHISAEPSGKYEVFKSV